ncbi:MAG: hypothetical protein WDZ76_02270 [Pseudohongiellaceae bacterium]
MNKFFVNLKHGAAVTLCHYLGMRLRFRALVIASTFIDPQPKQLPAPSSTGKC